MPFPYCAKQKRFMYLEKIQKQFLKERPGWVNSLKNE